MIAIAKLIIGNGNNSTTKKNNVKKNTVKNNKKNNTNKNTGDKRPVYTKSPSVKQAEADLENWEKNKPGAYKSKYSGDIDTLLDDILNREDFEYNMNADPMYQQYSENYIQNGKKAMMDTIGQATALTGGYLNSYAATVGNQVYDEYLNEINQIALELRDRAYEQYVDEGEKLIEDITILRSLDGDEYDRYWNTVQQYYKDGEYLVDKLVNMSDAEFDAFLARVDAWESDRNFAFEQEKEENDRREFDEEMSFKKEEAIRDQANKDRDYNLEVTQTQQKTQNKNTSTRTNTKTQNKKNNGDTKSNTKNSPKTYREFCDRTGVTSILTESEFYSSPTVRKKYSTYPKYLEKMYEKYG